MLARSDYSIFLFIYNTQPYVNPPKAVPNQNVHINQQIEININEKAFIEADGLDICKYMVQCTNTADDTLPTWLSFYEPSKIMGIPNIYKEPISACT